MLLPLGGFFVDAPSLVEEEVVGALVVVVVNGAWRGAGRAAHVR